ncbi:HlyD family efflux transporter periplasmic adaptor subunit [Steroidobacter sp. S1-65]|uniref:HlyD family efflux transporter periplasmic adaptor subunit n=1 Tax=Steroidobacter gossypii TaxID=2805490 RepID=A0ABS1WRJ4_9GAMM|nr:HlyD family efflux transporter periplasmic adaptor subunit [Steroidobacter gossypii]MBM0103593.1 HlyD family efflux transporter periplasmic adaptor subunit [Steroidobacter gossypii]
MSDSNFPATGANGARRRGLLILTAVVALGAIAYTAYWLTVARYYESTDDAYAASDIVQITSEVPGAVLGVHVDDTQTVERGQVLVELDPADANIAVSAAEAELARTVRQVRSLYAQADQLRAQIAERESELKKSQSDYARRQALVADGAVSGEELAHAQDTITQTRAALQAAQRQLDATLAQTEGTTLADHPNVLAAAAQLRDASLALRRTTIRSPVTGTVAKRGVQVGQHVAAGAPLLAVVPLDDVWIDANFKESQLKHVRVGQPVVVHADIYGDDVEYLGTVAGLAAGSGSAFALLPAQNASGNWIKIVQRVPVRIALDPEQLKKHPLRVGLSMHAEIEIRDTSGPLVATQVRNTPQPLQKSVGEDPGIEQRIAEIIHQNASGVPATVASNHQVKPKALTREAVVPVSARM